MVLDWDKLRSDFDVRDSFEELCCQLARYEQVPPHSQFIRKAPPDAGVECFWILPDGNEFGWQAKYFRSPPSSSQWTQIDDSVKKALEKHPKLSKYVICLPIDRSDSRITGQKSFLDRWNEHKKKWEKWSKKRNKIKFEFWGTSEIGERLTKEEHRGRLNYFFDKEIFSQTWFKAHLKRTIANAGPRYSQELNVKLPIAKKFDTLGRTEEFLAKLKILAKEIIREFNYSKPQIIDSKLKTKYSNLKENLDFITTIQNIDKLEQDLIELDKLIECSKKSQDILYEIISKLEEIARSNREKATGKHPSVESFSGELHHLWTLQKFLRQIQKWASDSGPVANVGALLIKGEAGNGKTHLFCDVTSNRINSNHPTILIHGGHFVNGNPKPQILQELDFKGTFENFLTALESSAQANNSKAIIMIDAINEGEGQRIWLKYLPELLETIAEHRWIGIALSVRTSYESIIPQHLDSSKLPTFTHVGFGEKTEEATKIFFEKNGINRPRIPLLVPEFSNPQFLVILCKGLREKGLTEIPTGIQGITSVYDLFIDTVNEKLSKIDFLDFEISKKIVQKATYLLAEIMAKKNTRHLSYEEAETILNEIYLSTTQSKSLLHHLISEGILSQELFLINGKDQQVIQFAYERFGDNLIIKNQLSNVKNLKQLKELFQNKDSLGKYFENEISCSSYKGLIEALSIQIPEQFGKEIIELKPNLDKFDLVLESFLDSFIWRHPNSIKNSSIKKIEKYVIKEEISVEKFLGILLTLSSDPNNPLNAEYLHDYLSKLNLPVRDSVWSTFLHYDVFNEDSVVKKLIRWGWFADKTHIRKESIFLTGLALGWLLTSSNRFVRDRATKALVSLLQNDLDILRKIITKFKNCDDPYVVERILAITYGISMRSDDLSEIKKLAKQIYDWIFKTGNPPLNFLLRDYGKGVIDCALSKKIKLKINYNNVKPPYKSDWIKSFPTRDEVDLLEKKNEGTPQVDNGVWGIFRSVGWMGDFSRYILGTNSNSFEWSTIPLLPGRISRETKFKEFDQAITKKQKTIWDNFYNFFQDRHRLPWIPKSKRKKIFGFFYKDDETDKVVTLYKNYLITKLDKNQKQIFSDLIDPYLSGTFDIKKYGKDFDLHQFENWIIKKVFDLGWTKVRFGYFDQIISHNYASRETDKPERIGKKYQWIAFDELLARASDNFEMESRISGRPFMEYQGPWQLIGGRDIDPSLLLTHTFENRYDEQSTTWWFPHDYDAWEINDDTNWLKNSSDIAGFESILEVTRPNDGTKWFVLGGRYTLRQKTPIDKDRYEIPTREIWLHLDSCLVKKKDIKKIFDWTKKQNYLGIRLPEHDSTYDTFLGELFWANSVQKNITYGEPFWTDEGERSSDKLPTKVYVPVYAYVKEKGGYDCSVDEYMEILLPNKLLVEKMKLKNKSDGTFVDKNDNVIAFDPSIYESGPGVLLVKKEPFLKFLKTNNYDIIWHIIGQKLIIGGSDRRFDRAAWKGDLEIYAAYRLSGIKINGFVKTQYVNIELADKRNKERKTGK